MKQIIICEDTFEKARNEIRKNKGKEMIFSSSDDELNRKVLEKEKIDFLLINLLKRKDRMKQRDSGFNQVLAKLAKKNSVVLGINFDEIVNSRGKAKAEIFGRLRQNIKLCSKNKLKMKFFSLSGKNSRNVYDLKSLGLTLGMPTWMTRDL